VGATVFTSAGYRVLWNGVRWVAGVTGGNTIAYSTTGTTWYGAIASTSIFTTGYGVGGNPQTGLTPIVDSKLVLTSDAVMSNTIQFATEPYYQGGYNNIGIKVTATTL
jgi:hypothetical protein